MLRSPDYTDPQKSRFNCYVAPNYTYTRSMQDCYPCMRLGFNITKNDENKLIITPIYGRTNKTYRTLVLYINKNNPTKWILKQITVDINFGPIINTFYIGDDSSGNFIALNNNNIEFPSEFLNGIFTDNLTYNSKNSINAYNSYNSPFAPLYRVGYEVINYANGVYHWKKE
jgi:hypothetical protein